MGFSTSAAVAVVAIGALISLGVLYPAVEGSTVQISQASEDRQDRVIDARNSGVEIQSVTYTEYDDAANTLTVEVDNTGTVTLDVSTTDLLVDGELQTDPETTVDGEADRELWVGSETLEFTVEGLDDPPERIVVTGATGVQDSTEDVTEEAA